MHSFARLDDVIAGWGRRVQGTGTVRPDHQRIQWQWSKGMEVGGPAREDEAVVRGLSLTPHTPALPPRLGDPTVAGLMPFARGSWGVLPTEVQGAVRVIHNQRSLPVRMNTALTPILSILPILLLRCLPLRLQVPERTNMGRVSPSIQAAKEPDGAMYRLL
jgi:hypothetical protein